MDVSPEKVGTGVLCGFWKFGDNNERALESMASSCRFVDSGLCNLPIPRDADETRKLS